MHCFFLSRRESITGESPTSFPEEDSVMPYSGFKSEPTRLQAEGHIHYTGWAALWDFLSRPLRRVFAFHSKNKIMATQEDVTRVIKLAKNKISPRNHRKGLSEGRFVLGTFHSERNAST
ncbi:hypothetical protein TNCV_1515471 [Trichonephila clavipes]|nr:hypothetical protein TNCV_1515471 [Trichonephila clavipes]